jgi:hypothetical protein
LAASDIHWRFVNLYDNMMKIIGNV